MPLVRASSTPTITAAHYSVGDAIGSQMQFNVAANKGLIFGCRVLNKTAQKTPLELWLLRASTTGGGLGDNQPFAPSDTQLANLAGVIRINEWFANAGNSIGQSSELPFSFNDLSGGLFYGWLVSRGEPVFTSTSDLTVQIETDQAASSINRRKRVYYWPRRNPRIPFDVGDAVGTQFTWSAGSNAGAIVGCRVLDKGRQSAPVELWLFKASTTGPGLANNEPFAPSDAQLENAVGVIRVADWYVTERNSVGQAENLSFQFGGLTDGQIYGWLVTRGTPAYAGNDLSVQLQFERATTSVNRRRRVYYRPRQYPPLSTVTIAPAENYHTIHLKIEFDPPANLPASTPHVTGSYLRKGRWVKFHPALLDAKGDDILYTVLFGLDEDTTYPVKLEFTRTIDATGALIERQTFHRVYRTRVTPTSANTATRYISPAGVDSGAADGSSGNPFKTIPYAIANPTPIGVGGTVVLKNGTYDHAVWDFASTAQTNITFDGSSNAYSTIKAENEGMAIITGRKLLDSTTVPGGWTQHGTIPEIWYASFSNFIDTGFNPDQAAGLMRNEFTGNALFLYYHLTTDQGADSQWEAIENGTLEGWLVDWTNSRVYVRKKSASGDVDVSENSGGNVKLTMVAAHGLVEGDRFAASGHSVGAYNVAHKVIEVVSDVTVKTDVAYTADGADGTWTTATAPISGEYSASINRNRLLDLVSCDYLILDGLAFDMCHSGQRARVAIATSQSDGGTPAKVRFNTSAVAPHQLAVTDSVEISDHTVTAYNGSRTVSNVVDSDTFDVNLTFTTGGSGGSADPQYGTRLVNGSAALRLSSCTNVVIRNCVFTLAGLSSHDGGNNLLTIEDNTFTGQDLFGKFIGTATTLNSETMWNPVKDAGRNETSDISMNQGGGNQTVVRRNTFSGGWFGINASSTAGNENNDYYENEFADYLDSAMGFEGFGTNSGNTNAAAWHNRIDGSFSAGDFYPFAKGPFWLIANRFVNLTFNSLRKGDDTDSTPVGSERGCGHLLVYHNTLWTEYQDSEGAGQGLHPWITFNGQGNTAWTNNILSGTGNRFIADFGFNPPSAHRRPIGFTTNAFYTTASPAYWTWRGSSPPDYDTEAEFIDEVSALDDDETLSVTMVGNIYGHGVNGTKPFPSGIDGGLNAALKDIATQVDGITELAGDASGNLILAPLDLGYFPKWASM